MKIHHSDLTQFCETVFQELGVSKKDAQITTEILVKSDLFEITSHGVARLKRYIQGIRDGIMIPTAVPFIESESNCHAVIDAENSLGQVSSFLAIKTAIKKAKENGIATVTVKNSNHFGIAGYYALMAAQENLIGISMTNASPIVVPTFGKSAVLGTNPLSFSAPIEGEDPFLFDMATSTITKGKLEVYKRNDKDLSLDWALDENGLPTADPGRVLNNLKDKSGGGLMPLGGYKGFGLGIIVEILSGIMSGSAFGTDTYKGQYPNLGHCFIVLDPTRFMSFSDFSDRIKNLISMIQSSAREDAHVWIAGEKSFDSERTFLSSGVEIEDSVRENLIEIGEEFDIKISKKFFE